MFIPIEFQKIKEKTKENCFLITASYKEELDIMSSKFGGSFFLPKGENMPLDDKGEKLALLAQINFLDLPENSVLPKTGLLQFFLPNSAECYGLIGDSLTPICSKYYPDTFSEGDVVDCIWDDKAIFPVYGEHKLEFGLSQSSAMIESLDVSDMCGEDSGIDLLESIALNDKELEQFYDAILLDANVYGHRLLGHSFYPSHDPRDSLDWVLLLQIDSDDEDDNDIFWGDQGGCAQIFIRKDDLLRQNFDNCLFYWSE